MILKVPANDFIVLLAQIVALASAPLPTICAHPYPHSCDVRERSVLVLGQVTTLVPMTTIALVVNVRRYHHGMMKRVISIVIRVISFMKILRKIALITMKMRVLQTVDPKTKTKRNMERPSPLSTSI